MRLVFSISGVAMEFLVDSSPPMIDALRTKLDRRIRSAIVEADFSNPAWRDAIPFGAPFDIVISGFSIHHQPDQRKRSMYGEIFELLAPGGVFLNQEHVASATPAGESLFDELFIDFLFEYHSTRENASTRDAIAFSYYKRPDKSENILAPVGVQCEWLREIGFHDVDVFFKTFELAVFGGRRSR
jgi:SAM-dependent methyltransferase